jgi:Glycosyl hydrolase family 57
VPSKLCLIWYYHLPWVSDDAELGDLARESLGPLLAAHEETRSPVTLALSGALLARLSVLAPEQMARLRALVATGLVEIAGTFHHEVFPAFLSNRHLAAHLQADRETKRSLLGVTPASFVPGNFTWVPAMARLLVRHAYNAIVLDADHGHRAVSVQRWRWSSGPTSRFAGVLSPSVLSPRDLNHPYRLLGSARTGEDLGVVFRDMTAVRAISYGDSGFIQQPLDTARQRDALALLNEVSGVCVLADDGDRVNALSALAYRRFLEIIGSDRVITLGEAATAQAPRYLEFLPGHATADLYNFWLAGPDAWHWLKLLEELHQTRPDDLSDSVLRLHDVYPLFWRNHWRCRLFYDALEALLADCGDMRLPTHHL